MAMLETADGALYYEVIDLTPPWLTAPATMLFHHGVGTNADIWSDWLGPLAGRYRLVRFDTRGLGRTVRPSVSSGTRASSEPRSGGFMNGAPCTPIAAWPPGRPR